MNKTSATLVRSLLLGTSCLSALGLTLAAAQADPTGGVVVSGGATIGGTQNNTVINQSTQRALINWQNFSVAAGGSVQFNQPNSGSITVNRVIGSEASSINGSLFANGQVWLLNGNGILFGKGATINVGGLIATTSDIATRDFENGNFNFTSGTGASVINQGTIRTTAGGSVVLSGASVQNQGLIAAQSGTVVLGGASAFTIDFVGDGLIKYAITAPAAKADNGQDGVSNSGTIKANDGGRVVMTARAAAQVAGAVVNNTGMISATSARVANGEVILDAGDGTANVAGTIDVSGVRAGTTGGSVAITGRNITVADGTTIDASGDRGGGTVLIGGDAHGSGTLRQADNVTVGEATVRADAYSRGNGGKLVVWSNGITDFSGIFSAIGGAEGGNGGFVETSGHNLHVRDGASVNTLAPMGKTGEWLLDPRDITVVSSGGNTSTDGSGNVALATNAGNDDTINASTIVSQLGSTNVTLQASRNISVNAALSYSSANSLSLLAQKTITVNASIQNSGAGAVNLVAGWNGTMLDSAHFGDNGVYGATGGTVTIGGASASGGVAVGSKTGATLVGGENVTLSAVNGYAQIGYAGGTGSGAVTVSATGAVSLLASTNGSNSGFYAQVGNGGAFASGANGGDVTVTAAGA
ncbi:MAG: filamentous hemagglutinin N-terminal domain-containing protein, partial [Alphaproteobacteria bacterium]|nr:filamentous hemagglutinin N-terminal domain-containing protein [Alphaproteobacteria bacterium]